MFWLTDKLAVIAFIGAIRYWRWRGRGAWVVVDGTHPIPDKYRTPSTAWLN